MLSPPVSDLGWGGCLEGAQEAAFLAGFLVLPTLLRAPSSEDPRARGLRAAVFRVAWGKSRPILSPRFPAGEKRTP